jgi:hypothetical protein
MNSKKILIIDDDLLIAQLIAEFLKRKSYSVITAAEGERGLALAFEQSPDLVLCDLDMPKLDGWGLIKRLRANEQFSDLPVIFLSACHDREKIRQSINLGGDDFIAKPAELTEIHKAIDARLDRQEKQVQRQIKNLQKAVQVFAGIVHDLGSKDAGIRWLAEVSKNQSKPKSPLFPPDEQTASAPPPDYFLAVSNTRRHYVKLSEVKVFVACGEYSRAHWGDQQKMMFRKPLKQWVQELPTNQFIRVHRKAIINLNFLDYVELDANRKPQVHIKGFTEVLSVSQRCAPQLNRQLKQYQPSKNTQL